MSKETGKMTAHLSSLQIWAFALGTSVGWGSLVVTSNSYLGQAGPWGSTLGLILGCLVMICVARNYSYLMRIYPESGGAYAWSREVYGWDHGFLTAWFLAITYLAVLWANATSVPLFVRNFIGPVFQFVRMFSFFGYDVYLGETLLTIAAILLTAALCVRSRKAAVWLMTGLSCVFSLGILAVFLAALFGHGNPGSIEPGFLADSSALSQVIRIAAISPWAFIGFESVSHYTPELSMKHTRIFRVLVFAVISATLLYLCVTVLSVTAYPERYGSWLEYIRDRGNLEGLEAFPAFWAANHYLGAAGVGILMAALIALVITSLIGNTMALSRLFYALGKDRVLPEKLGELNEKGQPARAIRVIAGVSLLAPFAGRTAIGWIVDVTTIGATIIYLFVSAAALKVARKRRDRPEIVTGAAGFLTMIGFGGWLLLPNLISRGNLEKETFFLFIVWILLGLMFFRWIIQKDRGKRFGNSVIVWVSLVSLVLFISVIWMRQSMIASNEQMVANLEEYFESTDPGDGIRQEDEAYLEAQMDELERKNAGTVTISLGMFSLALYIMLTNHSFLTRRSRENEAAAYVDPMTGTKSKHAYLIREKEIDSAIEAGEELSFAVAVCDVNGLKQINDTQGHKAGDEYICAAGRMVCDIFQHSPVFRIGGDEFVAIMTGRDYEDREKLLRALHDLSVVHISGGGVVVSGGLGEYVPGQDTCYHDVFERADQKMYDEKKLLKGLGSISRDEAPEAEETEKKSLPVLEVRKQILIVDDQEMNHALLGALLQEDYDILTALDGLEALDILQEKHREIDTVLLDLQMPKMDGRTVLMRMKADPELRNVPVIVITGDEKAEVECLKMGAIDFLPKPYPMPEIVRARVQKCVELSETRETIQSTERDALTGLYNMEYFKRYVELYDRHYPDMEMDAAVVDVNQFHMINERYGKNYGNEILHRLGGRLRRMAREIGGVAAHQGADVFLLYCPHREDYEERLESISEGLAGEDGDSGRIRLRMGVYERADKELETERRFDRARMAAVAVRNNQRRCVGQYDDEMHRQAVFQARLLEEFRPSLTQGRFEVYFQPKYNVRGDEPVLASAEALVRWQHPDLGLLCPGRFIPLLENSGMITELDLFVWERTAEQIAAWKQHFGRTVPVSVNVSRIDMLSSDLPEILKGITARHGLAPADLVLEITESAYTGEADNIITMARALREAGFRIEMDDFGTGYSSLGMLTSLPIDALKLDMTFVRNGFGEKRDVRMIQLIIDIAGNLKVPVIAEGVETEEQMWELKAMGCDLIQGYYFSRPVPAEEFEKLLA